MMTKNVHDGFDAPCAPCEHVTDSRRPDQDEEGGYIDEGDDPFEEAVFNDY